MSDLTRDVDEVLSMKLAIEPTSATSSSLNELAGLSQQVIDTVSKTASAYAETAKQAANFRDILNQIDADDYARQTSQEFARRPQTEALEQLIPSRELAFDRGTTEVSLSYRGLDNDRKTVEDVSAVGIENVLQDTLERENGKLADQLSGALSRMASDIKDAFMPVLPDIDARVLTDADKTVLEKLSQIHKTIEESSEDQLDTLEAITEATAATAVNTGAEASNIELDGLDVANQLRSLGGRRTGSNIFDKFSKHVADIESKGAKAQSLLEQLDTAGQGFSLIRAGQATRGLTGAGALGESIGSFTKGLGAVASKAAIPVAVGAAAWEGLNFGAEKYRDIQSAARPEGYTGAEAFSRGAQYKVEDWWRGLNPFSSATSEDFANYRSMALNSGFNITHDDDSYRTFTAGAATMKDMGIDPRHIVSLFGRAIAEDPEFDVDSALQDLADTARAASISVEELAESQAQYSDYLRRIGAESDELPEAASETMSLLTGTGGIFTYDGALGDLTEFDQQRLVSRISDPQGAYGSAMTLMRSNPERYAELEAQYGNDYVGLMKEFQRTAHPTEIQSLLFDDAVGRYTGIDLESDTMATQQIAANLGIRPDQVTDQMMEELRKGAAGMTGEDNTRVTIEVRMGDGLVSEITSVQESWDAMRDAEYETQRQEGYLNTAVATHSLHGRGMVLPSSILGDRRQNDNS